MRRILHVANGTSLTGLIEAAGIAGARSVWCDVLSEGPVPGDLSDDALLEVRARFLAGPGADDVENIARSLRESRRVIADTAAYDELILWFEHDLFDQLNLVQLLSWIRARLPRSTDATLVSIGSFANRPGFKGMGELTPSELAPLVDARQPVGDEQYALAERAWQAFRQNTPEALDELRRGDLSALPFLGAALHRFLQEYPWTSDGLSRSERRALEIAARGPIGASRAFPRMHDGERAYYITDGSFASLVESLTRRVAPLLDAASIGMSQADGLSGTIAITEAGRQALAGAPGAVRIDEIDRWMGGVHLESGRIWRWDPDGDRVTRS
ncbi:MAG TPA: hypothetical protein VFO19_08290 [Vicinamibacterales bacterium]|nr:hypothetical protein [Vicinamibacterales bacterium]